LSFARISEALLGGARGSTPGMGERGFLKQVLESYLADFNPAKVSLVPAGPAQRPDAKKIETTNSNSERPRVTKLIAEKCAELFRDGLQISAIAKRRVSTTLRQELTEFIEFFL
jgi:hypothetical protein